METWGNAWPTYLYFKIRSEEIVTLYICYTNNEINEKSGCPQKMLDLLDNGQVTVKVFTVLEGLWQLHSLENTAVGLLTVLLLWTQE